MPSEFAFDLFLSYSSKDKEWVRGELLPRIEQAGLKAFIDFRDFTRGAPSIKEMERGVVECRKTLLVLTPNYIESEWAEIEAIMAQTLSPANRDLRLLPLLKAECKKPLRLGALTHIDFTDGADPDLAWRQLLTALGKPPELVSPPEPQRDRWFLAQLLTYRGAYPESESELETALKMFEKVEHVQLQGTVWAYRALHELLRLRSPSQSAIPNPRLKMDSARRALELADETARTKYPYERDYDRAHWLLGAAHRVVGQPDEAERHLYEALERCRRINMVDHEANILIDLARLRSDMGAADEARGLAEEARLIAERSDYVLQGADAHLELARLAMARGDHPAARRHAEEAHRLATCDGPPDYTYKAAYDEAADLLKQLRQL